MQELVLEDKNIENMIYEIRGVQVMLDSDLAKLFGVTTGNLNKSMKRNLKRFPSEFCFQLSNYEYESLIFQFGISNKKGGRTKLPYVYTEQGVAMISSLLHSDIAIKTSIKIINSFVLMRHYLRDNKDIYKSISNINNTLVEHDEKLDYLFSKFDKKEKLFFGGKTFDAYLDVINILNEASNEIIVIDNYADINFLDLIRNIKCNIILITKNSNRLSDIEINKYNKEYNNLKVVRNNLFHDRYLIIDKKDIYHLGTSINNIGEKIFMINKLEDETIKKDLIDIIKEII